MSRTDDDIANHLSPQMQCDLVKWRHCLHKHPELAFNERQTASFIAARLAEFGLTVHEGFAGTGVVGTLTRGTGRRVIAIRADMDALPIQEQSGVLHASCVPGVMHACGHDGHVVMALGAARLCSLLSNIDGTVHFIFQPAEENEGGAQRMIKDGLFDRFPCDAIYALHNWPSLPIGTCVALDGPMMAALGTFEIVLTGRGCHGAMPHEGTDCVLAACQVVSALQSIVARNVDPLEAAVISATEIHGGDTVNVIPDSCVVRGTTRWFDHRVGDMLEVRVAEVSRAIASAFGCSVEVKYVRRFPATINASAEASFVRSVASDSPNNLKVLNAPPSMGAEDFAYMLQVARGSYLWLGARGAGMETRLHSSRYDFNDDLLPIGVGLWASLVCRSLARR